MYNKARHIALKPLDPVENEADLKNISTIEQTKRIRGLDLIKSETNELRNERKRRDTVPEFHAQDSKAPSRRFRPGFRPDRCGSRCTLSFSRLGI